MNNIIILLKNNIPENSEKKPRSLYFSKGLFGGLFLKGLYLEGLIFRGKFAFQNRLG